MNVNVDKSSGEYMCSLNNSLAASFLSTEPPQQAPPGQPVQPKRSPRRCLFPPMIRKGEWHYPTVETWQGLGAEWGFEINQEKAERINRAVEQALGILTEAKEKNSWLSAGDELEVSPSGGIYLKLAPLNGRNKQTQWKVIRACSREPCPPVSLEVVHINPPQREFTFEQHFNSFNDVPTGLLLPRRIGNALLSPFRANGSMEDVLRGHDSVMSTQIKTAYCTQIALGLSYLHKHGIAHRDLRTDNIVVQRSGAWICDFGSYSVLSGANEAVEFPVRTTATEVLVGRKDADLARADVYSLGIVIHSIWSETTFDALSKSEAFSYGLLPPLAEIPAFCARRAELLKWPGIHRLPVSIDKIVRSLLEESPEKRLTLEEVIESIQN